MRPSVCLLVLLNQQLSLEIGSFSARRIDSGRGRLKELAQGRVHGVPYSANRLDFPWRDASYCALIRFRSRPTAYGISLKRPSS
jgi:hypothetical protein